MFLRYDKGCALPQPCALLLWTMPISAHDASRMAYARPSDVASHHSMYQPFDRRLIPFLVTVGRHGGWRDDRFCFAHLEPPNIDCI